MDKVLRSGRKLSTDRHILGDITNQQAVHSSLIKPVDDVITSLHNLCIQPRRIAVYDLLNNDNEEDQVMESQESQGSQENHWIQEENEEKEGNNQLSEEAGKRELGSENKKKSSKYLPRLSILSDPGTPRQIHTSLELPKITNPAYVMDADILVPFQSLCRACVARKRLKSEVESISKIQKWWRKKSIDGDGTIEGFLKKWDANRKPKPEPKQKKRIPPRKVCIFNCGHFILFHIYLYISIYIYIYISQYILI